MNSVIVGTAGHIDHGFSASKLIDVATAGMIMLDHE